MLRPKVPGRFLALALLSLAPLSPGLAAGETPELTSWRARHREAEAAWNRGDWDEATRLFRQAAALGSDLLAPETSWLGLPARDPELPPLYGPRLHSLRSLSRLLQSRAHPELALEVEREIAALLEAADLPGGHELLVTRQRLANLAESTGHLEEAARVGRLALQSLEAGERRGDPVDPAELWMLRLQQGRRLLSLGHVPEGTALLKQARAVPVEDIPHFDGYPEARSELAHLLGIPAIEEGLPAWQHHLAIGRSRQHAQDIDGAAHWFRRAAEVAGTAAPEGRARALVALARLGELCDGCALPPSLPLLRQAHGLQVASLGRTHPETLDTLEVMALHMARRTPRDPGKLLQALRSLVENRRLALGGDHPSVAESLETLSRHALAAGRTRLSLEAGSEALALRLEGTDDQATEDAFFQHSLTLRALERWDELAALYQRKLAFLRRVHGPRHLKVAWRLLSLAEAELSRDRRDAAAESCREAISILRETGPEHALETALDLGLRCRGEPPGTGSSWTAEMAVLRLNRDPLGG